MQPAVFPPDPSISLRTAVESDLPAIVEIFNAAIPSRASNAELRLVSVESRRDWFFAHTEQRRPLWVAEQGGRVVAWVGFSDFLPRYAYHITAEASLYVAPEMQGKGLGPWMLQRLIDRCPELGVANVISLVFAHNQPSLKLHERLGFERWGLLPGVTQLDDARGDVVVLGKKVG